MAKSLRTRPSDLLAVEDELDRYCLDRAVYLFGSSLQNDLDSVQEKNDSDGRKAKAKRLMIFNRYISDQKTSTKKRFREPGKR